MDKDLVLYHPFGRLETETLEKYKITREEIANDIRLYIKEDHVTYHMILGINGDGVVCSPIKDWTPQHPEAFSSLEVVPWKTVMEKAQRLKDKKDSP